MISHISLFTMYVTDQDAAKAFYVDTLGFEARTDITMGDGYRWLTVGHPSQPELEVTLMVPGPPLDEDMAGAVGRALAAGTMCGFGIAPPDCRAAYEELTARGVEFVQPPADRPYGVEAILRDNSGNWLVMVQHKEFTPGDFGPQTGAGTTG